MKLPRQNLSATRSNRLIDVGRLDDLSDAAKEHLEHNLQFIFDCPGNPTPDLIPDPTPIVTPPTPTDAFTAGLPADPVYDFM